MRKNTGYFKAIILATFISGALFLLDSGANAQVSESGSRIDKLSHYSPWQEKTVFGFSLYKESFSGKNREYFKEKSIGFSVDINQQVRDYFWGKFGIQGSKWEFIPAKANDNYSTFFPIQITSAIEIIPNLTSILGESFGNIFRPGLNFGLGYLWCAGAKEKTIFNFIKSEFIFSYGINFKFIHNDRFALVGGVDFLQGAETANFATRNVILGVQMGDFLRE